MLKRMSNLSSILLYLQQIGFCEVAAAAALLYDYLCFMMLTKSRSVWIRLTLSGLENGIWSRYCMQLSRDNMFYLGDMAWSPNECLVWFQIRMCGPYVFHFAMDIIMMKRIHALSHRTSGFLSSPKWILTTMATAFVGKNAVSITFLLLAIGPSSDITSSEFSELGTHVCGTYFSRLTLLISAQFPAPAFEALLFSLAFRYLIADVWEYWRSQESNKWKISDLMLILARDSTIYFAIIVLATALDVGNYFTSAPSFYIAISMALQSFLPYCFAPRLVINVKEHENRAVHMRGSSGGPSDIRFLSEGHLRQSTQQWDDFA
ncbi:hypothetical protein HD554DRAFT_2104149 [Boletus coccyginus]|nr:hypothetical protein HD554DRAFT_2104149 [Boletus coccyginus]